MVLATGETTLNETQNNVPNIYNLCLEMVIWHILGTKSEAQALATKKIGKYHLENWVNEFNIIIARV